MAENGPFGTPFLTQKSPRKKFTWGPLFASFPRKKEAINFFLGAQNGVFWVGPGWVQKVYVYVLFGLPFLNQNPGTFAPASALDNLRQNRAPKHVGVLFVKHD